MLAAFDLERLPVKVRRQLPVLCEGGFVERAENVLAFGLPGRGKTHLVAAIGYELVNREYRVLFTLAYALVQQLLVAKRDLTLEKTLARLDSFDAVMRYERRSVIVTSNLVFSQWDKIFKDPMTTAAAIDRIVHHAVILELSGSSYRSEAASKRAKGAVSEPEAAGAPT